MIEIERVAEYWTRWKSLEVTPTTAPYFRANKPVYQERLKELQILTDEIILDQNIPRSYQNSLAQQVFDSITILGRPNRNEVEELLNYGTVFVGGVATGVLAKGIVEDIVK